jgi:hypothetical protein
MAGAIEITIDKQKLASVQASLKGIRNGLDKVLVGAINDTSRRMVTFVSSELRNRVNIKKRDIDKHIGRSPATRQQKSARGKIRLEESERLSLKYFGAKTIKTSGYKKMSRIKRGTLRPTQGVRYQIMKSGGKQRIRDAFLVDRLGGHAFRRAGRERLPIVKLFGPSPWGVFVKAKLRQPTKARAQELLNNELDRRVRLEILRSEGRA